MNFQCNVEVLKYARCGLLLVLAVMGKYDIIMFYLVCSRHVRIYAGKSNQIELVYVQELQFVSNLTFEGNQRNLFRIGNINVW